MTSTQHSSSNLSLAYAQGAESSASSSWCIRCLPSLAPLCQALGSRQNPRLGIEFPCNVCNHHTCFCAVVLDWTCPLSKHVRTHASTQLGRQLDHTMCAADEPVSSTSLHSLDAEALSLILDRLSAVDLARVGLTCTHLKRSTRKGHQAAHIWQSHCLELLGDLLVSYVASAGSAAQQASTWYQLYTSARSLDAVHWSAGAPSPHSLVLCSSNQGDASCGEAQLARYGHTATAVGSLLVLVGGMLRDGAHAAIDVSVLDCIGRRIIQPDLAGTPPVALRHLCTALVTVQPGSLLHHQIEEAVHAALSADSSQPPHHQQLQQGSSSAVTTSGHTLLLFGGLAPDDSESGGKQLHALWLAADATCGTWVSLDTTGHAPAPRAYACCQPVHDGHTMIVYGGWTNGSIQGTIHADVSVVDGYLLLCIYLLDVNKLHWKRQPTWPLNEPPKPGHVMIGPSTCPGPRKQAMCSSRRSPVTGHEDFLVLGGCGSDGLADFVPYVLCLNTFTWRKGPVVGYLPAPRDAATLMRLSNEWLLLLGGKDPRGEPVTDVQRLHLPSLSWKPPAHMYSSAAGAAAPQSGSETVDFSATAGVVVGGCREGAYGVSIVPRLEVLLPGPPIQINAGATAAAAATVAGSPSFHRQQFRSSSSPRPRALGDVAGAGMLRQEQQQGRLPEWMPDGDIAGSSCRCGSCCTCLARKAASCCPPMAGYPGLHGHSDTMRWPSGPGTILDSAAALSASSVQQQQSTDIRPGAVAEAACEIEPAAYQPLEPHASSPGFDSTNNGAANRASDRIATVSDSKPPSLLKAAKGGAHTHYSQSHEWRSSQPGTGQVQRNTLVQVLAAVAVVMLGLLLAYPSMMLQTTELGELDV